MAEALLITRKDLVAFTSANGNIDADKFLPYVKTAQDIHITNYTGSNLIEKIQADIIAGTLAGNYLTLLQDHLKWMLVWWAMVEYLPYSGINLANGGIYTKNAENSTPLSRDDVDYLKEDARNKAQHYTNRFIDYMCFNQTLFPEYTNNTNDDVSPDYKADFGGWVL